MRTAENLDKPFNIYVPIAKSYMGEDGDSYIVEGPLSNPEEDLEGDIVDTQGLLKGMETFHRLNGPVDYDHRYAKEGEPKWLIGKGIQTFEAKHPRTEHTVPWLRTKLLKGKEIAEQVWEHLVKGGSMGYSIYGGVAKKHDGRIDPIVTMVSVTPIPVVAENSGCLQLAKALTALNLDPESGISLPQVPELWVPDLEAISRGLLQRLGKALEMGGTLPRTGPGADALGVEDFAGKPKKRKPLLLEDEDEEDLEKALRKAEQYTVAHLLRQRLGENR